MNVRRTGTVRNGEEGPIGRDWYKRSCVETRNLRVSVSSKSNPGTNKTERVRDKEEREKQTERGGQREKCGGERVRQNQKK